VEAMTVVGSQEPFASQLESMLKDRDVPVRIAAIGALAGQKTKRAAEALQVALDDTVPEVRFAAAKALFTLHDDAGRKALLAVLSERSKTSSGFVSDQLREAMRLLQTPRQLMMLAAKQGIGMAPVPYLDTAFSVMERVRSGKGDSDRAKTVLLLAEDQDASVSAALQSATKDKDGKVRAAAARALAIHDDPVFAGDLMRLLDDKNQQVRLHAAAGFLRLENLQPTGTDAN
jgi:HEAT repeat protein